MGLGKSWRKVDASPGAVRANGSDGNGFVVGRSSNDQLVARSKRRASLGAAATPAAEFEVGCACTRIRRERRAARRGSDFRNRDGFDSVADAVDIQPDLVAR